jgi:hypothetical protein
MRSPRCLCVLSIPLVNFCTPEPIFHETWYVRNDTRAHLKGVTHKSFPSVCVLVCASLLIVARQRLGRHIPEATNKRNNRRIVGGFVFCTVRVL